MAKRAKTRSYCRINTVQIRIRSPNAVAATMSVLAHKWVSSGALQGQAAFAKARVVVSLHGIMGSGRNWMTAARQLVKRRPDHKVLLVDLRGHGANTTIAGPHTVASAARDVAATVSHATGPDAPTPSDATALLADGTAPIVLGHSFGGKVGLAYAASRSEPPVRTWLFDSNPTKATSAGGVGEVLAVLEDAARNQVYESTKAAVAALEERGLEAPTAQWLAMTTAKADDGVRFAYDLDAVRALYDAHCQTDLLTEARALDADDRLGLVIAGAAGVVPRDLGLERTYVLEASGHNVHVDALPALLDVVSETHAADWR